MTTLTFTQGRDAAIIEQAPGRNGGGWLRGRVRTAAGQDGLVLVKPALTGIQGRTITSATLATTVDTAFAADTWRAWLIDSPWGTNTVTWPGPSVVTPAAASPLGALAAGDLAVLDVTNLVQQVANGFTFRGFRVGVDGAGGVVRMYEHGATSWVLTVEVSEAPQAPDSPQPNGRTALSHPVLSWVWGETAIDVFDPSTAQVQIDPNQDGVTPAWESGSFPALLPQLDLAATTFPGVAAGQTTYWRPGVPDLAGGTVWGDWAELTRTDYAGLTVLSPTGGTISDPSPVTQFQVAAGPMEAARVLVTPAGQPNHIRYDSGLIDPQGATSVIHQVAARYRGGVVFDDDDASYDLRLRAHDYLDRAPSPGDPGYMETVVTVVFDDDASLPVTGVFATQVGGTPLIKIRWTRGAAADGWAVIRDGKVLARLDHADVAVDAADGWSWHDHTATGFTQHVYRVRPLTDVGDGTGARTWGAVGTESAAVTTRPMGLWLYPDRGDVTPAEMAVLDGEGFAWQVKDRRSKYSPPHVGWDVHIITAFGGLTGQFAGSYNTNDVTQADSQAVLNAMRSRAQPVRLAYSTLNRPVHLVDLMAGLPSQTWMEHLPQYDVAFECFQSSEFDVEVG